MLTSGFMVTVYVDRVLDEPTRRAGIYRGDIHMQTGVPESGAIVEWARALIGEAFGDLDPQRAQFDVEIEEFVRRVGPMKSRFTNDDRTKELVVDPASLPPDAEFKGYEEVVVQDVVIRTDNVLFRKEKWYAPSTGQIYLAALPGGYQGEYGPGVRALTLVFYWLFRISRETETGSSASGSLIGVLPIFGADQR